MQNVKRQIGQGNLKKESDSIKADKAIELMRYNVIILYN
jgi:hypothetical protein